LFALVIAAACLWLAKQTVFTSKPQSP